MRFDYILIGFLLFGLFIIGGAMMITDINKNYDLENVSDDKFKGVYDKVDEVYGIQQDAEEKTLGAEIEGGDESWQSMTTGSYSSVRLMTGTFPLFINITYTIADELSIPPFIPKVAILAFFITIIFGVVYLIFRYSQDV